MPPHSNFTVNNNYQPAVAYNQSDVSIYSKSSSPKRLKMTPGAAAMATGQRENWNHRRPVIGWSAAGFVAINIVAVNYLTGVQ